MKRLFLSISKGEELRFLGHLDMLRTMERAVIRSGIPIAFSEGFNPHMKIAFDARSEERRVGKECRSRWSPYH